MSEPEKVVELANKVSSLTNSKLKSIHEVTGNTHILALNALIEASRAGAHGRGFAVVANEVKHIAQKIREIADSLDKELSSTSRELSAVGEKMIANIRGQRLADLAFNMIEIIDRNLYERSCDVRWWATDSAAVEACTNPCQELCDHASKRLKVILGAYTVYLDLWLCDTKGNVIAHGRPDLYPRVKGANVANSEWFRRAMHTADGNAFVAQDVETNPLLDGKAVATYATAVREDGDLQGEIIGVLGIFFDWTAQAQTIVEGVRLHAEEKAKTRCLLVDANHRVIAASDRVGILNEVMRIETRGQNMGNYTDSQGRVVGFALTPGYETYQGLGWYGVIVQR